MHPSFADSRILTHQIRLENRMKKLTIALMFLGALAGCATSPPVHISWNDLETKIPGDRSLIYFVRPESIMAGSQIYAIRANRQAVVDINTGYSCAYLTAPGQVKISAKTAPSAARVLAPFTTIDTPVLEVKAEPGRIVFVKIGVSFFGGPTLEQVDTATGQRLVNESRDATTTPSRCSVMSTE